MSFVAYYLRVAIPHGQLTIKLYMLSADCQGGPAFLLSVFVSGVTRQASICQPVYLRRAVVFDTT